MKVMIVDDEKPIRQWFEFILRRIPEIEITGLYQNGKAALEACEKEKPDIIFTDIIMPIMDGIEEITEIKKKYPEIEIVILSNYDDFEYVYKGLKLGAEDYLLKAQADEKQIIEVLKKLKEKIAKNNPPGNDMSCNETDEKRIVKQLRDFVELQYQNPIKLSEIAEQFHYHPDYLSSVFKKQTGRNFSAYVIEVRMEKAKELLKSGKMKIREVAIAVGYSNEMYFSTAFKKYEGISPKNYLADRLSDQTK